MKLLRKLTAFVSAAAVAAAGAGFTDPGNLVSFAGFGITAFAEDNTEACDFEVTGTGYTIEKDSYYEFYFVKIGNGANVTIKNKNPGTSTEGHIEVESGANVEITLAG